jgi:palmitoyltransferase ZDHHC5/8
LISRSNPSTPTQPRRPDFIGVNQSMNQVGATYYDFPMQHIQGLPPQHPYYQQQQQQQQQQQHQQMIHHNGGRPQLQHPQQQQTQQNVIYHGSPQRRFLSEGELLRQGAELSYARTNNTVDNIRELAGSPQRGVYMWKGDTSPGFGNQPAPVFGNAGLVQQQATLINQRQQLQQQNNTLYDYNDIQQHRSNPASPTQQQQQYQQQQQSINGGQSQQQQQPRPVINAYHPALRGGVPVFPPAAPSPQLVKRKAVTTAPTRPMSFVRALEMADALEMTSTANSNNGDQQMNSHLLKSNGPQAIPTGNNNLMGGNGGLNNSNNKDTTPDRASVYDMNYEISV